MRGLDVSDWLALAGAVLIVTGIAKINAAAGFIAAGLALLAIAFLTEIKKARGAPGGASR